MSEVNNEAVDPSTEDLEATEELADGVAGGSNTDPRPTGFLGGSNHYPARPRP